MPPPITSSRWGARTKRLVVIITLIIMGFVLLNLVSIVPLLVVAMLLSYLLWPVVNIIEQRVLFIIPFPTRSLAVFLTFLLVISGIVLAGILIFPVLIDQLTELGDDIPIFIEAFQQEMEQFVSQPLTINGAPVIIGGEPIILMESIPGLTDENLSSRTPDDIDLVGFLGGFIGSISGLTGPAFDVLGGAFNAIINFGFLVVIMFYFMRDGEYFTSQFVSLVPTSYKGDVRRMLHELGLVWNAYFRGQIVLSFTVGIAVYLAALLLGLPNAPIFGLLSGLLEFIPNFGPFAAMVPAATIALFSESSTLPFLSGIPFALVIIAVWIGIQNIEAFYLVPRVMGGNLNLHPVVVILAVIVGASVGGALGVILAAPATATFRLAGQYLYGKLFDTYPFPTPKPYEIPEHRAILVRAYHALRYIASRRRIRRAKVPTLPTDVAPQNTEQGR